MIVIIISYIPPKGSNRKTLHFKVDTRTVKVLSMASLIPFTPSAPLTSAHFLQIKLIVGGTALIGALTAIYCVYGEEKKRSLTVDKEYDDLKRQLKEQEKEVMRRKLGITKCENIDTKKLL